LIRAEQGVNICPETAMNTFLSVVALLAILAWSEGGPVLDIPGLGNPLVHRGVK
jgi:hypothetical protein